MARPLLTLCVMVKDEEHSIARTLESAKPWVDRWVVLDTGSTDRTKEVARGVMADLDGELHEEPFVDFSTSRNRALELCGEETVFILWLDADDELEGGEALRAFLEAERDRDEPDREAYYLRVDMGYSFDSARLLRSAAGWRFVGAVHEVLCHPDRPPPRHRIEGVVLRHRVQSEVSVEKSRARWERDVDLLRGDLARDPSNTRAAFYLGMTLSWLERWDEAAEALDRRIEMGGWAEEVFQAHMQRAVVDARRERPWVEIFQRYLAAHACLPHRAEPLQEIATHFDGTKEPALCFLFAKRGWELPYPSRDSLFVRDDVYAWRLADLVASSAFWIGEFEIGERAAREALRARPDDPRLRANLDIYLKREGRSG